MSENKNYLVPIAFLGLMFFSCGFALGINSLLVPVLQESLNVPSAGAYLLIGATFIPFLIFGYPAGQLVKLIGYKRTMAVAFLFFALSFGVFIVSASQESFVLFLVASFCCGTANAFLQTAINPYITILGPVESAAKRISVMGICNKLAWPISPWFITLVAGEHLTVSQLDKPFYIIIAVFLALGVLSLMAPLPEVKAAGEDENEASNSAEDAQVSQYANSKKSIFQFPHLVLGAFAIFFYVGAETIALATLIDYAKGLGLENAENYSWITPLCISVGYISGVVLIPRYMSQTRALQVCTIIALVGTLLVVLLPGALSVFSIGVIALGCSLMWPAFWPLSMQDLGKFTKSGASVLTMGLIGGAVVTVLFGLLKDNYGPQNAYWICLPCFLYIAFFAFKGHKLR